MPLLAGVAFDSFSKDCILKTRELETFAGCNSVSGKPLNLGATGMPEFNASEPILPEIHPVTSVSDPELRFLLGHWTALKGSRAMPLRAEIIPGDIKRLSALGASV